MGRVTIATITASSILTKASGFMGDYDYTLNPYSGCAYGCNYCYAAFFARDVEARNNWGQWVQVKQNALDSLRRMRTDLNGKTVYMSSVTDPYQPVERQAEIVRALLPELSRRGVRLVVQTRSPLVERDIDLLSSFASVRVNMTVTTDSDEVQRAFEPHCATNNKRLEAITAVRAAGIACSITMTPLLPVEDPETFAEQLLRTGVEHFVVQPFHADRGKFVAGTREAALRETTRRGWNDVRYRQTVDVLKRVLPRLDEGREGFAPE
jgi:DNA repair photolyase